MSVTCVFGMSFSLNKLSYFFGMSIGVYTWYVISLKFFYLPMTYVFGLSYLLQENCLLFWYVSKLCFRYVLIIQKIKYFLGMFLTYVLGMF